MTRPRRNRTPSAPPGSAARGVGSSRPGRPALPPPPPHARGHCAGAADQRGRGSRHLLPRATRHAGLCFPEQDRLFGTPQNPVAGHRDRLPGARRSGTMMECPPANVRSRQPPSSAADSAAVRGKPQEMHARCRLLQTTPVRCAPIRGCTGILRPSTPAAYPPCHPSRRPDKTRGSHR